MVPCRSEAIRPMKPRRRPLSLDGDGCVGWRVVLRRKGRENSRPEKGRRKRRWVRLRRVGLLVWWTGCNGGDGSARGVDFLAEPFSFTGGIEEAAE